MTTTTRQARPTKATPKPVSRSSDRGVPWPAEIDGVTVEREELLHNLPGAAFRISKLHLADGSMVFACRDCYATGETRGSVMAHRNAEHGARYGQKRNNQAALPLLDMAPDPVLEPREDGQPAPSSPMEMTLGEILALAPSLAALGDLVDRLETERDAALAEIADHAQHSRENQHKIESYDSMRDELIDLRLRLRQQANYQAVKEEMYALRAWKTKMIKKLAGLGFSLQEEDQ
jgi:hypothetical protein